ncbi:S-adenosyl-L-methionine-dependent methyltransferase [Aspergillus keveii]|uniref:S-adenosyl-L-methionine-dependent methyltransferase n=1 Tax=Aspergillus keveii TaxID=714993 RepID=A0ABR4GPR5_9EURO
MSSVTPATGALLAKTLTSPAALGFVPVAAQFHLFRLLADINKPATGEDVLDAYKATLGNGLTPVPSVVLIHDTLYAMSGLGLVDLAGEDLYSANALTRHLAESPSAVHGAVHFTTEALLAAAFLLSKLKAENFAYPFKECETPMQYAYKMMGKEEYTNQHTYSIMAAEGRMESFNTFMVGKFFKPRKTPDRLHALGYDLAAVVKEAGPSTSTIMVDIGGGRGELLLEIQEAYPQFQSSDLVVEEFNDDLGDVPGITMIGWNYKEEDSPQPVRGALIYHLAHILHNLPDLDAARLMQKVSEAMAPHSRLLVHEFSKNVNYAKMHSSMAVLYGGRERTGTEWRRMAALANLTVTFEAYPELGEGVVEFRRKDSVQ